MNLTSEKLTTIRLHQTNPPVVRIIDQRKLPYFLEFEDLLTVKDVYVAIKDMHLRGAPLIGVAAAFGMYLALNSTSENEAAENIIENAYQLLVSSRPTAVNLLAALDESRNCIKKHSALNDKIQAALNFAIELREKEIQNCYRIGINGLKIIEELSSQKKGKPINILTHCNAGWLACVEYGTATAPIYLAHEKGISVHVWVDETRPRNQGSRLTAWELGKAGVPHTIITDNTGGYLMQTGMVDMVIVGSDRTTATGDVANKIGTYLKALAAKDNQIPFYVALPISSIDRKIRTGLTEIEIEERNSDEVTTVEGLYKNKIISVEICPQNSIALNPGFDITRSSLITALITERGIVEASENGIKNLFNN